MKIKECCTVESQECIAKGIYSMWISTKVIAEGGEGRPVYFSVFEGRQPSSAASDFSL